MYKNLSFKFNELIGHLDEGTTAFKLATELRDAVMHEIMLAYGLVWNDNSVTAQDNLEDLLTHDEIEEGRKMADICPTCEGSGLIVVGFDDNPDVYENIEEDCPACGGSGLVQ